MIDPKRGRLAGTGRRRRRAIPRRLPLRLLVGDRRRPVRAPRPGGWRTFPSHVPATSTIRPVARVTAGADGAGECSTTRSPTRRSPTSPSRSGPRAEPATGAAAHPPRRAEWMFTGAGDAKLTLDGIFLGGGRSGARGLVRAGDAPVLHARPRRLNRGSRPTGARRRRSPAGRDPVCGSRAASVSWSSTAPSSDRSSPTSAWAASRSLSVRDSIVQAVEPGPRRSPAGRRGRRSPLHAARRASVHRLDASECILHDLVASTTPARLRALQRVVDRQRPAAPVRERRGAAAAALFASRRFRSTRVRAAPRHRRRRHPRRAPRTDARWAPSAGENAIKERSLLIKYQEYLPIGLEPVVVHVT